MRNLVGEELAAYGELMDLLNSTIPGFKWSADQNLRLERIEALLRALGCPQKGLRAVHVGGTSGKGTVATMTAAILFHHNLRVGLHVSPFVSVLTETWQINGQYARPTTVLDVVRDVVRAGFEATRETPFGRPSYFEHKVATAFELFARQNVDIAVVEVGLGGALDATNVLGPGVKILTNVGLDHTEILGDTVEAIARDKVQIFKPDSTIISGVDQDSVRSIARTAAERVGSSVACR